MTDFPRLIEHAFPLKQASLDSVHEKNVRHGHISTLHIWPARRPLAACRAALIATLLPDPSAEPRPAGLSDAQWEAEIKRRRKELCEKIGGRVVRRVEKKKMPNGQIVERIKEETEGGILHWGRETENADTLDWFRQEIRKAYGGRAPKVLDPFAGGGAIPLEAMRLGCEATAIDINPVAWFILKCTLEYPQKLAGQTRPLPDFILHDEEFMREFRKAHNLPEPGTLFDAGTRRRGDAGSGRRGDAETWGYGERPVAASPGHRVTGSASPAPEADLAWHVRAWGRWVLARARKELARFYPTYADFEPLKPGHKSYERQPMRLVPLKDDGTPDIESLNAEFTKEYLEDKRNPRWVAKPTVAYLWARTVKCKNCRASVPLLRTVWLSKKDSKRILVALEPQAGGDVVFHVKHHAPVVGGNAAQKREHDRRIGLGTMSKSGARCVHCSMIETLEDIQVAATSGDWSSTMVAVVVDGPSGKEYRDVTPAEREAFRAASERNVTPLTEPISCVRPSPNARGLSGLTRYGITTFGKAFNSRQLAALQGFVEATRAARGALAGNREYDRDIDINTVVPSYLALALDRLTDRNSTLCHWNKDYEKITGTFQRYALRVNWDYAEVNPFAQTTGNYRDSVEWIAEFLDHALSVPLPSSRANVILASATDVPVEELKVDLILTDPPYYDAIPYADLSDYYYVWLKRTVGDFHPDEFRSETTPKDAELTQHAARAGGDHRAAKQWYEDGMAQAFSEAYRCLCENGRLVIVFAHKQPDAWETLVSAIIRAGFVVDASWPIATEMPHKAAAGARLASSVWLICKKRRATARAGWDNNVLAEMRQNITTRLREFWDAGIRGPDFVWAATGPALEAYSKHPVVKKADKPGEIMTVSEFLTHVRRMVVDFVVGRMLSGDDAGTRAADDAVTRTGDDAVTRGHGDTGSAASPRLRVSASPSQDIALESLDNVTTYYLLHRHDFGMEDAPAGACILYATACGLSDSELADTWDILARTGGGSDDAETRGRDDAETEDVDLSACDAQAGADETDEEETGSGSKVKLKAWNQRRGRSMGYEAPGGKPVPLIDRVHRLMHLWKAGDVHKVDEYLDDNALRRNELFKRLLQSLIELSPPGSDERSLLESLSNHVGAKGAIRDEGPMLFAETDAETWGRGDAETKEAETR